MKYDDASWHSGGNFPEDLPAEAGATHIGMFVAWALLAGLVGEIHREEDSQALERLRRRAITPGALVLEICDGKFTDEDLNEEGNAFAGSYFASETGGYLHDYEATLASKLATTYHVPDTWESFDSLKPVLDRRFAAWRGEGRPRLPRWLRWLRKGK